MCINNSCIGYHACCLRVLYHVTNVNQKLLVALLLYDFFNIPIYHITSLGMSFFVCVSWESIISDCFSLLLFLPTNDTLMSKPRSILESLYTKLSGDTLIQTCLQNWNSYSSDWELTQFISTKPSSQTSWGLLHKFFILYSALFQAILFDWCWDVKSLLLHTMWFSIYLFSSFLLSCIKSFLHAGTSLSVPCDLELTMKFKIWIIYYYWEL